MSPSHREHIDKTLNEVLGLLKEPLNPWVVGTSEVLNRRYLIARGLLVASTHTALALREEGKGLQAARLVHFGAELQQALCCFTADHKEASLKTRLQNLALTDTAIGERIQGVTLH